MIRICFNEKIVEDEQKRKKKKSHHIFSHKVFWIFAHVDTDPFNDALPSIIYIPLALIIRLEI